MTVLTQPRRKYDYAISLDGEILFQAYEIRVLYHHSVGGVLTDDYIFLRRKSSFATTDKINYELELEESII